MKWPLLAVFGLIISLSPAGHASRSESAEPDEFHGILLNEQCATRQPEWLPFAGEHSISCAMLPICFLSGYYLVIDENNIMKLDRRGELLARALLEKTEKESDFRVEIRGEFVDSILRVHSIEEQG